MKPESARRAPVSAAQPLRIVIIANSVGYFVRPPGADRDEGPYAERLTALLADAGVPVAMTNRSRWFEEIDDAFNKIEDDVFAFAPDVVVLNFGWVECQPKLFPTATIEWLTTYRPNLNPATFRLRHTAVRLIGRMYKALTPWAATRWHLPSRMREQHFEAELERYIHTVRREVRSLVLVLNVNPPTARIEEVLPGVGDRATRFSSIIERVVTDFDDRQVRLVDARSLVLDKGSESVLPDGIHYNVDGHGFVAELLAEHVVAWLDGD